MPEPNYDVVVVGAGVSGCAIARELSRLQVSACVVEREEDVCCGTSKANSAIVHAGFDAQTGSLMARLNVEGARLMPALCEELGADFQRIGSLVVCTSDEARPGLTELLGRGVANGVDDLRIIERDELLALEPNVSDEAVAALWAPSAGIVNPFQLTVALAESASINGVDFRLNEKVLGFDRRPGGGWIVRTDKGRLGARVVAERPDYGRVVCRCRRVTEGQIVDAIRAPLGARSLDAVKRRTEAGMGRCQSGFCSPKVMEILAREVADLEEASVTKMGPGSELCFGSTRPDAKEGE